MEVVFTDGNNVVSKKRSKRSKSKPFSNESSQQRLTIVSERQEQEVGMEETHNTDRLKDADEMVEFRQMMMPYVKEAMEEEIKSVDQSHEPSQKQSNKTVNELEATSRREMDEEDDDWDFDGTVNLLEDLEPETKRMLGCLV